MCTGMIGHYFILMISLYVVMIGVTCSLALHVYGDDQALLYTYHFFIVMIGVMGVGQRLH